MYICNFQTHFGDGICNDELNNNECCYDLGDCGRILTYRKENNCDETSCDVINYDDGICDKNGFGKPCCLDKKDCILAKHEDNNIQCEKLTTWGLFDVCPYCCETKVSIR
jgi:hypothetical protein